MITPIPLSDYKTAVLEAIEEQEEECTKCEGEGICPCCDRECKACDGFGTKEKELSDTEIHAMYFNAVMVSLKKLCAYSSRHDFLTEAGDFIKHHGRPDMRCACLSTNDCREAGFITQPNITVH
jgi:hypothetical protein